MKLEKPVKRAETAEGLLATESAERIRCRDGWAKAEASIALLDQAATDYRKARDAAEARWAK